MPAISALPALSGLPTPSASLNCNANNAVGYPSGSVEDRYRQPAGCPFGVDKIPSVYSSISAASATAASTHTSINCDANNAVGYPSGSVEDRYRQPAGCPFGVDKIPSVYSSISAASATAAATQTSINCDANNAVGYPSGSVEDRYRQPAGCPFGVDKIPSVYSSISAAAAATEGAHKHDDEHNGGDQASLFWECTDPENPPDWAKGPNGEVTWRPVGCPTKTKGHPAPGTTWAVGPGTFHSPESETSWTATWTASWTAGYEDGDRASLYWECTDPENPPDWAKGPNGEVTRRPVGCPTQTQGHPAPGSTWTVAPDHGKEHHGEDGDRASLFWECTDPENPPDWAKGPNGEVRWRAIGCPPSLTGHPASATAAPTNVD